MPKVDLTYEGKLPEIPCKFKGGLYGRYIEFRADKILLVYSDPDSIPREILYSEIQRVGLKPTKYFIGVRVVHTILELRKTQRDYYSAPLPWTCQLSQFDPQLWPVILRLIHHYAPNALFGEWATKVMNARDRNEVLDLKI